MPIRWMLTLLIASILIFPSPSAGQEKATKSKDQDATKRTNLPAHRKQSITSIPGAPILSQPQWIKGSQLEIRTEKHGLIYPLFFDWNKDDKKDLLLGEFETGDVGSYVKVFLNTGSSEKPSYDGKWFYATDTEGNKITNHQWCCIGIHPRLVDMNNDGHLDLVSGQYNPGLISWWKGSEKGFLPRVFIPQEGYRKGVGRSQSMEPWNVEAFSYWNYTSADFGDFNGDGLMDLFVGGSDGPRVALNVGTKTEPKFGLRHYLLDLSGNPIQVAKVDSKWAEESRKRGQYVNLSGVGKSYVHPVDWNSDGTLDLLITHEYSKKEHNPVEFYRGYQTKYGLRFGKKQPLFTEANGNKSLPGVQPMITVTDYNNDGVKDLVFGLSVPTIDGFQFAEKVAWDYAHDLKIQMPGKDAGRSLKYYGGLEGVKKKMKEQKFLKNYLLGKLDDEKYLTMRHRGYPFVMFGKKNPAPATTTTIEAKPEVKRVKIPNDLTKKSELDGPVAFSVTVPKRVSYNRTFEAVVSVQFEEGWHGYADTKANAAEGKLPTKVKFTFSKGVIPVGEPVCSQKGPIYAGTVKFTQKFKVPIRIGKDFNQMESLQSTMKIEFQTCDESKCLPPESQTVNLKSTVLFNAP